MTNGVPEAVFKVTEKDLRRIETLLLDRIDRILDEKEAYLFAEGAALWDMLNEVTVAINRMEEER